MNESRMHALRRTNFTTLVGFLSLSAIAIGCGDGNPATYEVTGTVVFKDGTPLDNGSVEFETELKGKLITATGEIGTDGTFTLGTFKPKGGALPGKHRAAVFAEPMIGAGAERPDKLPDRVLHSRFSDFDKSGLEFTVKEEAHDFRIQVERAAQP